MTSVMSSPEDHRRRSALPPSLASRVVLMSGRCYDDEEKILAKPIALVTLINRLESAAVA